MRGRVARNAFALGSAGLVVLGIAACNQSKPEAESSQTPLKIVEQVQIDEIQPLHHVPQAQHDEARQHRPRPAAEER